MPADDALFFIDANKYLDLYRTNSGRKLLGPLGEQASHIFVTKQVVNEVQRNKIQVAAKHLSDTFKYLKLQTFSVPDHLYGPSSDRRKEILREMREIVKKINKVNTEVDELAIGILEQISHSEDEVSKALAPIFARSIPYSQEELQRAKERKEFGHPPGKHTDPIGDELNWEQILTCFRGKKRLWIISRDSDYGTVYNGKGFLNRHLLDELCKIAHAPDVFLFEELVEGIKHFVNTTGVAAEKRLTADEEKEIKKEEESLPPLDWLGGSLASPSGIMVSGISGDFTSYPAHQPRRPMPAALMGSSHSALPFPLGAPPIDPGQIGGY